MMANTTNSETPTANATMKPMRVPWLRLSHQPFGADGSGVPPVLVDELLLEFDVIGLATGPTTIVVVDTGVGGVVSD
jgi:hypothetical protein